MVRVIKDEDLATVGRARLLLMMGGLAGAHQIYLERFPEAFIYLSTLGGFLLGVFRDTFTISGDVDSFNARLLQIDEHATGRRREKEMIAPGRPGFSQARMHVPFSAGRFISSVLYSSYLGLLTWITGSLTFSCLDHSSLQMVFALSVAVSLGIYIVGNCGEDHRDPLNIWVATSGVFLVAVFGFALPALESIAIAASVGTIAGNRGARIRQPADIPFTRTNLAFWNSLLALLFCFLAVGVSEHFLGREVAIHRPQGESQRLQIKELLLMRLTNEKGCQRILLPERVKNVQIQEILGHKTSGGMQWLGIDPHGPSPEWVELLSAFAVDALRAEAAGVSNFLEVSLWRRFLVKMLDESPLVDPVRLSSACSVWLSKDAANIRKQRIAKEKIAKEADHIRQICKFVDVF